MNSAGEQLHDLFEHALHELDGRLLWIEDVLADAPDAARLDQHGQIAQLRIGADGGVHVAGHVDLRHDGDMAGLGIGHDLADLILGVEAAVGHVVKAVRPVMVVADQVSRTASIHGSSAADSV